MPVFERFDDDLIAETVRFADRWGLRSRAREACDGDVPLFDDHGWRVADADFGCGRVSNRTDGVSPERRHTG